MESGFGSDSILLTGPVPQTGALPPTTPTSRLDIRWIGPTALPSQPNREKYRSWGRGW